MLEDRERTDLVRRAIAEPLLLARKNGESSFPDALERWVATLTQDYSLWAFRPHAFARLNGPDLLLTYPLRAIVRSISDDEGLEDESSEQFSLDIGLPSVIDSRRCSLVWDDHPSWTRIHAEENDEELRLYGSFGSPSFPRILNGPVLAYHEPDSEYSMGGYMSPYEEIGVELVNLVEAREAARAGSPDRSRAQRELDEFVRSIARRVPGRPTVISDKAAKEIIEQGYNLVSLLWRTLDQAVELSANTRAVFEAYLEADEDFEDWAIRLALPIFSGLELQMLRREIERTRRLPRDQIPASDRFTIDVLAHRLKIPVRTIAEKVMHGWKAEVADTGRPCAICSQRHRIESHTS